VAGIEGGMTLPAVKGLIVDATTVDRFRVPFLSCAEPGFLGSEAEPSYGLNNPLFSKPS
jgi:hypothetical protein